MRSWLIVMLLIGSLFALSQPTVAQRPALTTDPFIAFDETVIAPPSAGANSVLLRSGQTAAVSCPGVPEGGGGILCPTQIAFDVPEDATGLALQIEANHSFAFFIRVNDEIMIQDGRAVSDVGLGANATLNFSIPATQAGEDFPGLQRGTRYFVALANFDAEPLRYEITATVDQLQQLTPNLPASFTCRALEVMCHKQFSIEVAREGELNFSIRGEAEFVALIRRDEIVEISPWTFDNDNILRFGQAQFDYAIESNGTGADFTIDGSSTPPLQPGTYHISFINGVFDDVEFTMTASLDGQASSAQPPSAGFGFSPNEPRVGDTVQFSDTSNAGSGSLASWSWDFGDGQTSTAQNPTHTYAAPGTYRVSLLVFNDSELSDTVARTITVLPQATATTTAVDADVAVLAFMELMLVDPDAWTREVQEGCVVYTNTSSDVAVIQVVTLTGQTQTIDVAASDSVIVCGNAIHLNV